jgi:prevent-host-death family protein
LVEQGEDVVITRHGKPVARLVPPEDNQRKKTRSLRRSGYERAPKH